MKRVFLKRTVVVVLVFCMAVGGIVQFPIAKSEARGLQKLSNWYKEYQITGSEVSQIKDADGIVREQATRYVGSTISIVTKRTSAKISGYSFSMGYRAYRVVSGKRTNGFVTCAHGLENSVDGYIYLSNLTTKIGKIEKKKYDGSLDAAFVSALSGNNISNKAYGKGGVNVTLGSQIASVSAGNKVSMCGGASGLIGNKKVLSANCTAYVNNKLCSNLIKTEAMSKGGDSGAPVFKYVNGKYQIVGIIRGGDGTNMSYVTKATAIKSSLGAIPY